MAEEKTRYNCGKIVYRLFLFNYNVEKKLCHYCRCSAYGKSKERTPAEDHAAHNSRGQKRDDNVEHYAARLGR